MFVNSTNITTNIETTALSSIALIAFDPPPPHDSLNEVEVVNADYNVDDNNNRHTYEGDGDVGDGDSENIECEKADNASSKAAVCM